MKKSNIFIIALFVIATLIGCKKTDLYTSTSVEQTRITASTDSSVDSKVSIDGVTVKWAEGDTITLVELSTSGAFVTAIDFAIDSSTISEDGKSAEFTSSETLSETSSYIAFHGQGQMSGGLYNLSYSYGGTNMSGAEYEQSDIDIDSYYQTGWMMQSDFFTKDDLLESEIAFDHSSAMLEMTISSLATVYLSQIEIHAANDYFAKSISVEAVNGVADPTAVLSTITLPLSGVEVGSAGTVVKIPVTWNEGISTAEGDFTFTITTTSGDQYSATKTAQVLESGARYSADLTYDISIDDLIAKDRAALVALYESTNGDEWWRNSNWCSEEALSEWQGITINGEGRVIQIMLVGLNLNGEIPSELGNLSNLITLDLSVNNSLSGEIPSELGSLSNLNTLNLSSTSLSGEIPSELGNLSNLNTLNLSFNTSLSGVIPLELGNLSNLTQLYLYYTSLSGEIPSELGNLSKLQFLYLQNNSFSGEIPSELGNLSELAYLDLSGNSLSGEIPSELVNLSKLWWLYLQNNSLSGEIPSELGTALTDLQFFDVSGNCLTGDIPQSMKSYANYMDFVYTPQQVGYGFNIGYSESERLALIDIYNATDGDNWIDNTNWCSDLTIDHWYGVTVSGNGTVSKLSLSYNELSGEIPAAVGNLSEITSIDFRVNELSGSIPSEIGNLSEITYLDLYWNKLSGSIPSEIGLLSNLKTIYLDSNDLTGEIPSSFADLDLAAIFLNDNNLTGEIPSFFGDMKDLWAIYLLNNNFTGGLASELGDLSGLSWFDVTYNRLTGEIPQSILDHENYGRFSLNPQQEDYGLTDPTATYSKVNVASKTATTSISDIKAEVKRRLENR